MAIKRIRLTNFKSFRTLEVELGKFDVLIGANASGKSNFVQIFRFLRDIVNFGLTNAISMQGGVEYLRNINIGPSENFYINLVSDQKFGWFGKRLEERLVILIDTFEVIWEFALKFEMKRPEFEIVRENVIQKCNFVITEEIKDGFKEKEKLGKGEIIHSRVNGKVETSLHKPPKVPIEINDIFPEFLKEEKLSPSSVLLETRFSPRVPLEETFGDISIYDFDPKLPKKGTPITGKAELEEDGSNLSIVIKNILENKEEKRKLFNFVKDLLPFIDKLGVEKFADKSLLFKLREIYSKKQDLPASLISDGTINIIALILALYFEEEPLTIIEEPGRNMHPYLIGRVIEMMKDASQKKQIIVTTHNPEIVKSAGLENLFLVGRDREGFSTISRPGEKEQVKIFLKNELGIEDLYLQNLLGE